MHDFKLAAAGNISSEGYGGGQYGGYGGRVRDNEVVRVVTNANHLKGSRVEKRGEDGTSNVRQSDEEMKRLMEMYTAQSASVGGAKQKDGTEGPEVMRLGR